MFVVLTSSAFAAVGAMIATGRMLLPAAILGLAALVLFSRIPHWGYPVILVSVSGFINVYSWPRIAALPGEVYLSEALLLIAVAAALPELVGGFRSAQLKLDWIWLVLGGLFLANLTGVAVGIAGGAAPADALLGFRPLLYLLAFMPAVVAFSRPEGTARVLAVASILAVTVSVAAVVQIIVGDAHMLFVISGFDALVRSDPATGFLRVRPPGLYLVYAAASFAASCIIWAPRGKARSWALVVLPLTVVCMLLSFNRNMIVGLIGGMLVSGLVSTRRQRLILLALAAAVAMSVVLLAVDVGHLDQPLVQRFSSLFDPEARTAALDDRGYESAAALATVLRQPLLGIGWGRGYGALATRLGVGGVTTFERPWIHNQYLGMWVRAGLAGGALLVVLFVGSVVSSAKNARWADDDDRWVDLGLTTMLTAYALSSIVDIVVLNPNNCAVLVGALALVSVRSRRRSRGCTQIDQ